MAAENASVVQASLLGIPPELRLSIYNFAWPDLLRKKGHEPSLDVRGSLCDIPGRPSNTNFRDGPWALLDSCREIRHELVPLIPAIGECVVKLDSLTYPELKEWLALIGETRVAKLRDFSLRGRAHCTQECYKDFHFLTHQETMERHMQWDYHAECPAEPLERIELGK